mmetsp:Transcript_36238/g.79100  ORF Transcript_36238/g.79100 Transcript_36238/m.79100 type:complete len:297 (+) Transcript_36238:43-933(+)
MEDEVAPMSRFELRSLFQTYDRVSDGHLAREEFVELLDATCDGVSQDVAESVFKNLFDNKPVDQLSFVSKFNAFWTQKELWIGNKGKPPAALVASPRPSSRALGKTADSDAGKFRGEALAQPACAGTARVATPGEGRNTLTGAKAVWPTETQPGAPESDFVPRSLVRPGSVSHTSTAAERDAPPVPPDAAWAQLPDGTRLPLVCSTLDVVSRGTQTESSLDVGVFAAEWQAWSQLHQALGALGQFRSPSWVAAELRRRDSAAGPEAVLRGLAGLAVAIGDDPVRGVATLSALSSIP